MSAFGQPQNQMFAFQQPAMQMPNIQQFMPEFEPTYRPMGLGAFQRNPFQGPSVPQMFGGMVSDYNLANQLNQANFARNQQAADMFLAASNQATGNILSNAVPALQTAFGFQQQGQQQAGQDYQRYLDDVARTRQEMADVQQRVGAEYDRALEQAGQGYTAVASDMAQAIARRKAADEEQMMGEIGSFLGTEGQLEEAKRQRASSYDREMFGTLAGIQAQTSKEKSDIMQRKGDVFANLGTAMSNLSASLAKTTFDVGERRNSWNEFGAQLGQASAQLMGSLSTTVAELNQRGYSQYASMIQNNPVMGVMMTPTLMAMADAARVYGGPGEVIYPQGGYGLGGGIYGSGQRVPRLQSDGTYRIR
jgi:hypothetical protein